MKKSTLSQTATVPDEANRPDADALVAVSSLTFWYGSTLILDDVTFQVREGEFVSIIGASGCGKSTLLQLVDGALKPDYGTVRVGGRPATERADGRAMVFQHFALMPWKTVLENVRLGLDYRSKNLGVKERTEIARAYIARVGLTHVERSYPYQLSGGMQQRVGLARAFAVRPSLLLMDEPFGALDAQNAEILRDDLRELVSEERRSVVFVTHNLDEAMQLSDRILLMRAAPGRVEEDLDLRSLKSDPQEWERSHYAASRARLWEFLRAEVETANQRDIGRET